MRIALTLFVASVVLSQVACGDDGLLGSLKGCAEEVSTGKRPFATSRDQRFLGKVQSATARCRGGLAAVKGGDLPWVDWTNYFGAGDASSKSRFSSRNLRGINGALIDLEFERVELIRFNLFDNMDTYPQYIAGRGATEGPAIKTWKEMRLPASNPDFKAVGGDGEQLCKGDLIRSRTISGICNDMRNPLMGSAGTYFARNVEFETTFPDLALNSITQNRHGGRIGFLTPDPQVVSRRLLTRPQTDSASCAQGYGKPGFAKDANCDYTQAPFFNVLAAYWIQFMTHDWFSHMVDGHNTSDYMKVGCASQKVNAKTAALPEIRSRIANDVAHGRSPNVFV